MIMCTTSSRVVRQNQVFVFDLHRRGFCPSLSGVYLIGTTHLFWNPTHPDVKLKQMAYFLQVVFCERARIFPCAFDLLCSAIATHILFSRRAVIRPNKYTASVAKRLKSG